MSTHARCHVIGLAVAIGLLTLLACTLPGQAGPQAAGTKPTVTIIEPAPGTQVTPGTAVAVRFMAVDASGIARVELLVDNASANSQVAPQPVSAYQGTFTWIATTPGPHALLVRATNTAGATSDPAVVSVLVTEAGLLPAPTAGGPLATVAPPPVATQPSVSTLRVAPDGSGDYPTLAAAVAAAPAGATIQLAAGTYNLTQPLDVAKPLRLTGAGMDATSVVGQTGEYVVRFTGPGTLTAEGITFRYAGTTWARVMVIKDGEVDLVRCRFTGAVRDSATEKGGTGLWLQGDTRGQVRECRAESNGLHGIYVQDQAQPTLEGNICTGNDYTGIVYFDDASGVA
ncbi:MAG: right-handed parallel beta-helix repeat-containing protein, partial [Chloroflexi bacterium]|nr:right-handed parallel beta-helix repeat-containing protein [Chloroflexota bacterium]